MKKIITSISLLLFFGSLYSQIDSTFVKTENTSPFTFSSGINSNSIILNTKLGGRWSLQNELVLTQIRYSQFIEIPMLINYSITNNWSVYFGAKLNYNIKNNFNRDDESPNFGASAVFGTRYDFTDDFFGELIFNHNFNKKQNSPALGFNKFNQTKLKLKLGYQF